ncbi:MAG: metal ABC transporter permease [Methanomassiliicoccus sp.]|nr:metal ABC transporter permease [Methanomassiliicoccus sp.]
MIDIVSMFGYAFFQRAFLGGLCAAVLCSILGVFIVLRRSALIGEGVAHLSFGGIALGLFLSVYPLDTALLLSLIGTLGISYLQRKRIVYSEMAIGIMISFGLGLGAVLASMAGGFSVDLFSYLFGSILTISSSDLELILVLSAAVLVFVLVFYKELMYMTFDEQGARLSGVPVGIIDLVFNIVLAFTVVVSIKIIGSLLISALLIIPASSAMQLSKSFRGTVAISVAFGIMAVLLGLVFSFIYDVATGGVIVLISIALFLLSVVLKKVLGTEAAMAEGRPTKEDGQDPAR